MTCALHFFTCSLDARHEVVRLYSHELVGVPIYFSSNDTGSTASQDWVMEDRMCTGVCTRAIGHNVSDLYLVDTNVKQHEFSFSIRPPSVQEAKTALDDVKVSALNSTAAVRVLISHVILVRTSL